MNKLTTAVFVALMASTTSIQTHAQSIAQANHKVNDLRKKEARQSEVPEVSPLSKDAFYKDFSNNGSATWEHKGQLDEVAFTNNGVKTTAFYGFDSKLIGSTVTKTFSDLPAVAQTSIIKDYKNKGYQVGGVILFDDNENNDGEALLYGSQFTGEDHYFVTVSKKGKESILLVKADDGQVNFFQDVP